MATVTASSSDYPVSLTTRPLLGEDRAIYQKRLLEAAVRLFSPSQIDVEVLRCSTGQ